MIYYINEQKKYYKEVLYNFIIQLEPNRINEILTDIIKDVTKNGEANYKWSLFEQVLNDYESQNYDLFQDYKKKIDDIIDLLNSEELSKKNIPIDKRLDEVLTLLNKVAEPIKTLKKFKRQHYVFFENIYYSIRDLYLKASNEYSNYTFSIELIRFCQIYFSDFDNLYELIENDRKTIDAFIHKDENTDYLFYAWGENPNKKSIKTDDKYFIINDEITIEYNQIIKYKFSNINKNGGELNIIINHSKSPIEIKIPNVKFCEKLRSFLAEKVALLLAYDYLDILRDGEKIQIGNLVIYDDGIELTGKSIFGTKTKKFTWYEIKNVSFDDNKISVTGPGSFKVSEGLDVYYNMEVIKTIFKICLFNGINDRLSDSFLY